MTTIMNLGLDVLLTIINDLDNITLARLSSTCTFFAQVIKRVVSFRQIRVRLVRDLESLDIVNYRAGVAIGTTFYMPFINEHCYAYDLEHGGWTRHLLQNTCDFQPQITCASVIGTKIYLVCGRLLHSYTLSNAIIEIDINHFYMNIIKDTEGTPPRPRHEHSVDVILDRYLVVFGGLCYNSVGENDVFVFDTKENRWFVPPISGQVPHLRFGHASAVIGYDLYIHGGAQLDNDSYVVYDDLYKLDCQTWTWYKFEHPEVERYLRARSSTLKKDHGYLIPSFGNNPLDRFQSYMCSSGKKLIIFGGHSIMQDENDQEVLYTYALDEVSVFNTHRCSWSYVRAERDEKDSLNVADMSAAVVLGEPTRIFIVAARRAEQVPRWTNSPTSENWNLPHRMDECNNPDHAESDSQDNAVDSQEKSKCQYVCHNVETRSPNMTDHSESVKLQFSQDPDMLQKEGMSEEDALISSHYENSNKYENRVKTCTAFIDLIEY